MKLLVTTQAVDVNEPVLGFFHRWLEELAARTQSIEVICLTEGEHRLPENVRVHTLGKPPEAAGSLGFIARIGYTLRFYALAWKLRGRYDTVLVHMNPEYVVLAGPLWHALGKPVALWYNHPARPLALSIAAREADRIFYTSPYAASAAYRHALRMPAGIDTDIFKPQAVPRDRHRLYMQGRVTPGKRVQVALAALRLLRRDIPATLSIVGPEDSAYAAGLKKEYAPEIEAGAVSFMGPRRHNDTPALYGAAGAAINLASAGHFDKSALEPMACGTPVVVGSPAFGELVPPAWVVPGEDPEALAAALARLIALPDTEYEALGARARQGVVREQSLAALMDRLAGALSSLGGDGAEASPVL
jgi:glycosyltransferase involved in cell wall biosynthesis